MKLIDLANRIYNKEELPKKIKCDGYVYKCNEYNNEYHDVEDNNELFLDNDIDLLTLLDTDVEIVDDKDEQIKEYDEQIIELIDGAIKQLKRYRNEIIEGED